MSGKKRTEHVRLRTAREKKFVKNIVQTGEIGRSAVLAGYSDPSYGTRLLQTDRVKRAILVALDQAGIEDSYLARKLKEGCEATYPLKRASNGEIIQDRDPDYFTQAIYLDKILKVRGDYAPEKHEVTEKKIVVMITPDLIKGLVDAEAITEIEAEEVKQLPPQTEDATGKN